MLYRAHTVPPALRRIFKWCCLRLSMHVLYSGFAQTLCMCLQWGVAVNVLLYTWKTLKHMERSRNPKKTNFFPGKRGVPLMCGNLTATNSTSFLCSSVFYIAVNLYSLRVCFSMTCHSYFIFISLMPKEIFFTDQIFLPPAPCLFFVIHLLEVLEKVGWLLLFLGCLELRFLIILAVVWYTWLRKLMGIWHLEYKTFILFTLPFNFNWISQIM